MGNLTATITELPSTSSGDPNCLVWSAANVSEIVKGNVTMTWTANTLAESKLRLAANTGNDAHDFQITGASPLRLEFPGFPTTLEFRISAHAGDAGIARDQTVRLDWQFEYLGKPAAAHALTNGC